MHFPERSDSLGATFHHILLTALIHSTEASSCTGHTQAHRHAGTQSRTHACTPHADTYMPVHTVRTFSQLQWQKIHSLFLGGGIPLDNRYGIHLDSPPYLLPGRGINTRASAQLPTITGNWWDKSVGKALCVCVCVGKRGEVGNGTSLATSVLLQIWGRVNWWKKKLFPVMRKKKSSWTGLFGWSLWMHTKHKRTHTHSRTSAKQEEEEKEEAAAWSSPSSWSEQMGVLRALIAFNFPTELPRVSCRGRLASCLHRALPGETAQTVLGVSGGGLRVGSGTAVSGRYCSQRGNLGGSSSSSSCSCCCSAHVTAVSHALFLYSAAATCGWLGRKAAWGAGGGLQLAPGHQGPESVPAEMFVQFKKKRGKKMAWMSRAADFTTVCPSDKEAFVASHWHHPSILGPCLVQCSL